MGGGALKAAAEDHVSLASHNRANHQGIFSRVVFEICVLHDADLSSGRRKAGGQGRALALVYPMEKQGQIRSWL